MLVESRSSLLWMGGLFAALLCAHILGIASGFHHHNSCACCLLIHSRGFPVDCFSIMLFCFSSKQVILWWQCASFLLGDIIPSCILHCIHCTITAFHIHFTLARHPHPIPFFFPLFQKHHNVIIHMHCSHCIARRTIIPPLFLLATAGGSFLSSCAVACCIH